MHSKQTKTNHRSGHLHVRVTEAQQRHIEERAEARGMSVSDHARMELTAGGHGSREARLLMTFVAVSGEIQRLTLEAAHRREDLLSREVQERIEREAVASADGVVERRLFLMDQMRQGVAA
jgi:hypothetical protein